MIIGLVNQKGGSGKTTLSLSIAYESWLRGNRTLLVDADPQQSVLGWAEDRESALPSETFGIISMPTRKIHRDIHNVSKGFDVVIIDGPPRSTDITNSIILASDLVIVPCTPSGLDIKASLNTLDVLRDALLYCPALKFVFAINRKVVNTAIGKGIREAIEGIGEDITVLKNEVCMRTIFAEAMSSGNAVQEIDNEGKAKNEIKNLYDEAMEVLNEKVSN